MLTAKSILKTTLITLQELEAVAVALETGHGHDQKSREMHQAQSTSSETQALARLLRQCRSYLESTEVMESRAAKLIDLVSYERPGEWC